jgi:hypothetical protein
LFDLVEGEGKRESFLFCFVMASKKQKFILGRTNKKNALLYCYFIIRKKTNFFFVGRLLKKKRKKS